MVLTLHGESAPSYSMVKKLAAEFKRGKEGLEDDPCLVRPITVTTQETTHNIHDMRLDDRYLATHLCISQERVHAVIRNEL